GERLLPDLIPPLVELSFVFCYPFFWCVMWCMRSSSRIVKEPRLVGRKRVLHLHPGNRFVGQITVEYVIGLSEIRLNWPGVLIQSRMPLIGVASDEAVKILEAQAARP